MLGCNKRKRRFTLLLLGEKFGLLRSCFKFIEK
nr:MAG TPA: hypothetical protein [Caudoviricetes sp.]